ncbi:hypothetical protein GUJ93_ZPchr0006g42114 [Zizania palustris]|uniref:Uncharacterized protein n=1 Tax=Zizania palustris TaxID=103762 RepID=A0A8J5SLV2_ZIZPA|nr:hypothetical protein GUJ93_ZPchr0006g42114 [Zizania palustris]
MAATSSFTATAASPPVLLKSSSPHFTSLRPISRCSRFQSVKTKRISPCAANLPLLAADVSSSFRQPPLAVDVPPPSCFSTKLQAVSQGRSMGH